MKKRQIERLRHFISRNLTVVGVFPPASVVFWGGGEILRNGRRKEFFFYAQIPTRFFVAFKQQRSRIVNYPMTKVCNFNIYLCALKSYENILNKFIGILSLSDIKRPTIYVITSYLSVGEKKQSIKREVYLVLCLKYVHIYCIRSQ